MNKSSHSRLLLHLAGFSILVAFGSCSEPTTQENRQPMTLKMDIPKPKRLPQSPIKTKNVPLVKKSKMKFTSNPNGPDSQANSISIHNLESCLNELVQLEMIKNQIQRNGGLWGGLEQTEKLKEYSPIGMQIDSRINKIAYAFRHLCKTAKGLDYSPLAKFVLENLKTKSEEEFKHELIKKGESKTDIEIYINYGRAAQNSKTRTIQFSTIQPSVAEGARFIEYYQVFYNRLKKPDTETADSLIPDLMAFIEALDLFLSEDTSVKIAVKEDFEKPFWMVDGDM